MPAVPVRGISSMATRELLAELADGHARRSGHPVAVESVGGVDAARRIAQGERFDFAVLAGQAIGALAIAGHLDPASRIELARSGILVAVPAGAARPDLSSEASVRSAVLAAGAIACSTGPSGQHFSRLLERWGIARIVGPRLVVPPPGVPVGRLLARGEAEIGFQQASELLNVPGIDVAGPLPAAIQETTVFAAAVCSASMRRDEARELLDFFRSPEADAAKRRHGLEP